MQNDDEIMEGSGNVFADLGYRAAGEHQTKACLVSHIAEIAESRGLTQVEIAETIGIDQPKVSAMLNGRFRGFSVYGLMRFISALGHDVEIVTRGKNGRRATVAHIEIR